MELLPAGIAIEKVLCRYDAGLLQHQDGEGQRGDRSVLSGQGPHQYRLGPEGQPILDINVLDLKVTKFGGEYYGEFEYTPDGWKTPHCFVFCVQIKGDDWKGQQFLINDVVYHILATNLPKEVTPRRAFVAIKAVVQRKGLCRGMLT